MIAGLITWAAWPDARPAPRERHYRDATACLLTDARGVTGPEAAAVWAGMQQASLSTLAKVQFLEVDGAQTAENARTYLASLVRSRCDLVLAVGAAPVAAVSENAADYPDSHFVVVGGGTAAANVSVVGESGPEAVRNAVSRILVASV